MAIEEHIDNEILEDRESVAKFLRSIAGEFKYDSVFLVGRNGEVIDALWYGDNLAVYSMACLGKKSIWNVLTGQGSAESKHMQEEDDKNWDLDNLK